ncbi:C-type lectin lectoxin-Thr1-like [Ctenocephalides felis]|uniref:C-type lectin lectoxin-Thr1-like n=1 Tax=Ctenocephalides felis TaxID=7515 RepID=UPI000E6E5282|nr:C-type lectin lectoxin-Thr1-like [Ctenocephalides felis]
MKIVLFLVVAAKLLCSSEGFSVDADMDLARVSDYIVNSGEKKFIIVHGNKNWFYAKSFCENVVGGKLAAIENVQQYHDLREFARETYSKQAQFWIAGNNILNISTFQWHLCDAKEMSFQKWAPGQPDNYNEEENCVEALFNSKIEGWNDVSCLKGRHFICEKPN